jgi:signal transduction histidine kinase
VYANAEARRLFFEGESPEGQNFLRIVAQAPDVLRLALLGDSDELFSVDVDGQPETYHLSRRTFTFDGEPHTLLLVRHLTREVARREVDVLRKVIRVISHELNNSLAPVASLVHSARLIAKTPEHLGKLDRVFDTIEERARHLTAFLSSYADLARIPKPRPAVVRWAPLLAQLSGLFPAAKIAAAPEAPAYFDAAQIEQVLINVLKNATEAGGAASDVALAVVPEPEGAVTVEITDRGPGLTQEALESAFVPFYSTKTHGSGLGLALCREVVEAHGGRMSIKNRNGGGCAVTCWLPGKAAPGRDAGSSRARLTLTHS